MKVKTILAASFLITGFPSIAQKAGADSAWKQPGENYIRFDDTRKIGWSKDFEVVEIRSGRDNALQKAYFYKAKSGQARPLIVSLHTWSGNYTQKDDLAGMCKERDVNYIHPDFRGENKTTSACCSELALADIDDAITFAMKHAHVDTARIYVMGVSGGGFATLSTFMKSKQHIKKFSSWAPITDLAAWYEESTKMKSKYAQDILACTGSTGSVLNVTSARQRSPLYLPTPVKKLGTARLFIYEGVYDGIKGSVPITHAINMYNKILADLSVRDSSKYVTAAETRKLLETRRPLGELGAIGGRKICLQKQYGNVRLTLFDGAHEMLTEYALDEMLKEE